jgi:hypothetical protein
MKAVGIGIAQATLLASGTANAAPIVYDTITGQTVIGGQPRLPTPPSGGLRATSLPSRPAGKPSGP